MNFSIDKNANQFDQSISPLSEMAAYEAMWKDYGVTFKTIAEIFRRHPGIPPSKLIATRDIAKFREVLRTIFYNSKNTFGKPRIFLNGAFDYPARLRDAKDPVELLYNIGNASLLNARSIAIIGTRKPTNEGLARTAKLVKLLVAHNFTIVSGLAAGIDTQAHQSAITAKGNTIAVVGTPLNQAYPKDNSSLQHLIAKDHLVVSQVPYYRYSQQDYRVNRGFFPERNKTMSALTEATVIVEASDISGTLIQAKAALEQGRKLFILESCFQNSKIRWPQRFEEKGAVRVRDFQDIKRELKVT